mmetsp:Transcript_67277/g.194576  ORF Transcript_67277/g.194576 Transcript_67277/m.194576 type:complete len:341 (-) Transcript_67277:1241-2263(-)
MRRGGAGVDRGRGRGCRLRRNNAALPVHAHRGKPAVLGARRPKLWAGDGVTMAAGRGVRDVVRRRLCLRSRGGVLLSPAFSPWSTAGRRRIACLEQPHRRLQHRRRMARHQPRLLAVHRARVGQLSASRHRACAAVAAGSGSCRRRPRPTRRGQAPPPQPAILPGRTRWAQRVLRRVLRGPRPPLLARVDRSAGGRLCRDLGLVHAGGRTRPRHLPMHCYERGGRWVAHHKFREHYCCERGLKGSCHLRRLAEVHRARGKHKVRGLRCARANRRRLQLGPLPQGVRPHDGLRGVDVGQAGAHRGRPGRLRTALAEARDFHVQHDRGRGDVRLPLRRPTAS